MGKSSQRKGAGAEYELAAVLRDYGYKARRGGTMTLGTIPDVVGLPDVHIEVKRVEHLNVSAAMKQSIKDAERLNDGAPALFHRKNREPWLVTMRLDDWMKIYRKVTENDSI